jgi:sugar/nucleoside kinase (ribokinase family)
MMTSPPDRFYYGGEIGFMYGHWSGKGGGDMMQSYIIGGVGNDHFQINAGAALEDWNGHAARFHSFGFPR